MFGDIIVGESNANKGENGKDPGDILILFTGADFGQGMTPTTLKIANGVRQSMNGGTTIVFSSVYYLSLDKGTQDAYDEILSNYKKDPSGKVILYGYSYGGVLVNYLAKRLQKAGIKVKLMITIDAANGWGSDNVDRTVSDNVEVNENYYEENVDGLKDPTKSHWAANKAQGKNTVNNHNKSKDNYDNAQMNHMNIDDATVVEVTKKVVDILNTMKDGERKSLSQDEIRKLFNN